MTFMKTAFFMIKRHKETKRSVLLSRKENYSFAGQPVVCWERKTGDQYFGEEKESHDRRGISENRIVTDEECLHHCL